MYERIEANIGEGTYGKVHKARDLRTGRTVAIKKAKASQADRDVGGIGFIALREIKLMQAVKHPNVMTCLDVFFEAGVVHLVMEFMDGDLKKLVEDRSIHLAEAHVMCLARQLLAGIAALHQLFFVHRDVAPSNVLLSFSDGLAKLSDFGFSRTIGHGNRPLTPMCTTLWYRAPELLYGARLYGQAVDVWSCGAVIAELFTRQALFQGRGELDMLMRIFEKRGTPNEDVWKDVSSLPSYVEFSHHPAVPMAQVVPAASSHACNFLEQLLSLDPKKRPSADMALQHSFFTASLESCEPASLPFVGRS
jgi:cyclin-dependent kinase 7